MQAQLSPPSQAAVVCSAEDQPSTNDLSLSAWASGAAPASASADTDIQLARYTTQTDIGRKDESSAEEEMLTGESEPEEEEEKEDFSTNLLDVDVQ
ncbi:hypothetical protein ON010_g14742 [Phytophthora cinnamomi]|nr:hypothetical protein ON010_g14742 [Phytophthora cinnamomi]